MFADVMILLAQNGWIQEFTPVRFTCKELYYDPTFFEYHVRYLEEAIAAQSDILLYELDDMLSVDCVQAQCVYTGVCNCRDITMGWLNHFHTELDTLLQTGKKLFPDSDFCKE
jgi:hypothetical protein